MVAEEQRVAGAAGARDVGGGGARHGVCSG